MSERHLTCPKCGGQFDYEFVWGASLTAVRLGGSRYLRCPLCQKWALFRLLGPDTKIPPAPLGSPGGPTTPSPDSPAFAGHMSRTTPRRESASPATRRFSDLKITVLGGGILGSITVAIVVLSLLLPQPEPRLAAVLGGVVALAIATGALFIVLRVREKPRRAP